MKKRLDILLAEKGSYPSREKAKEAIKSSRVKLASKVITKPSLEFDEECEFEILPFDFVSRGGIKLQNALVEFNINLNNKTVLDIGASTGGFTDVCLQNGAKKVYAVDTGKDQLDKKLQADKRVVNLERTNYLNLDVSQFQVDFVVIDVSFVSITKLIKKLSTDFEKVEIVALIKPQFEVGIDYAKKHKGIIKDEKIHKKVLENVKKCFKNANLSILGETMSSIKGGDGNTEFLLYLKK